MDDYITKPINLPLMLQKLCLICSLEAPDSAYNVPEVAESSELEMLSSAILQEVQQARPMQGVSS